MSDSPKSPIAPQSIDEYAHLPSAYNLFEEPLWKMYREQMTAEQLASFSVQAESLHATNFNTAFDPDARRAARIVDMLRAGLDVEELEPTEVAVMERVYGAEWAVHY